MDNFAAEFANNSSSHLSLDFTNDTNYAHVEQLLEDDDDHEQSNVDLIGKKSPDCNGLSNPASSGSGMLHVKKGEKKIRKTKCAFQTRSQVDILDDGYRWRKYGQKAVKNSKFPRSYYRCTYQGCNVKKQVQRLSKDEGVVLTTYEGIHSHPIEKPNDNFEHVLTQMQIYSSC